MPHILTKPRHTRRHTDAALSGTLSRMQSKATTVKQYLAELPADRREALEAVRKVILANLDKGFEEGMGYGMMGYSVPHSIYPAGYHCDPSKPLPYAGLASQKNYMSVYLMSVYGGSSSQERWFRTAWAATGKKLDMGKCCVRFKRLDDLALDVIGEAIRRVPLKAFVEHYERAIRSMNVRASKPKPAAAAKKAAKPTKPAKKAPAKTKKKAASKKTKRVR